eukprot:746954-Hanusia_phi.AAC.1
MVAWPDPAGDRGPPGPGGGGRRRLGEPLSGSLGALPRPITRSPARPPRSVLRQCNPKASTGP